MGNDQSYLKNTFGWFHLGQDIDYPIIPNRSVRSLWCVISGETGESSIILFIFRKEFPDGLFTPSYVFR